VILSACSAKEPLVRTKIVTVPGPSKVVPIKEELTEPCPAPNVPTEDVRMTNRDTWQLAVEALGAVEDCNTKLRLIRGLQPPSENPWGSSTFIPYREQ
jgi:hypothetical protein